MRNRKLLIIDFDKESLNSLSRFLEAEGFWVLTSNDGLTGLELFLAENPHLVILEAMLPRLDGFDLCTKITTAFPSKIPVIIISGVYRDSLSKTEALRSCGASAFFPKPVKKEELLSTILNLLNLHEPEKEKKPSTTPLPLDSLEMLSRQSLETVQASPRNENGGKKELDDLIDQELHEAFGILTGKPKEKEKKSKRTEANPEIDRMLKNTLAEFGLEPEKKSAPACAPKTAAKKEESAPPVLVLPVSDPKKKTGPGPQERKPGLEAAGGSLNLETVHPYLRPTPGAEPRSMPPPEPRQEPGEKSDHKGEARPAVQPPADQAPSEPERGLSQTSPYDRYAEKKHQNGPPPRVMIFGAASLIVAGSFFVFFRPHKHAAQPSTDQAVSQISQIQSAPQEEQPQIDPAGAGDKTKAKKENVPKTPPVKKDAANAAALIPTPEKLEPLLPAGTPDFKIQEPSQKPAESSAPTHSGETQPKGDAGEQQAGSDAEKSLEGSSRPEKTPAAARVKLGDLVPLNKADTPPQIVSRIEPVYPPLALQRQIEGSVAINALISENGDVLQVVVTESQATGYGLEKAAETAVRKWKFKPATKDGVNVRVWKPLLIVFKTPKK